MLSSKLLRAKKVRVENGKLIEEDVQAGWYQKYVVSMLDKVDAFYAKALGACLRHKGLTLVTVFALFIASLVPAYLGFVGTDFMQKTDNGRLTVKAELQRTTRVEETAALSRQLEARIMELVPEVRMISSTTGSPDDAGFSALINNTSNNKLQMTVVCSKKYERERTIFEIAEVIRKELAQYPQLLDYSCEMASGMGGGGASTVDIEVYGYDFDATNLFAEQIKRAVVDIEGARDIVVSRDEDRPELKVVVDKEKAARHGLNSATVASYVRSRINGYTAGYLKEDGDEYDILVRLSEEDRNSISDIENLTIPTQSGKLIKLSELASVQEYLAPPEIERKTRQRMLTIKVTPHDVSLGELAAAIQAVVEPMERPAGVTVRYGGDYEEQQESFADIGMLFALIIILVYVVMASQFESLSKPFIIMMSVPFAISGVIISLWVTGTSLDMIGALGIVMLVGIVVKNGIVLVDYINLMRDRGYELNEAIQLSGQSRLRPVLMTAFTTLLGMVPMAVSNGEGSEMWRPLGIVVIGGLLVSTLVTLIVVPVMYGIMSRHGERDKEEQQRRDYVFMQIDENLQK
jgi:HAE1 family hydrophobic/amphiphilic exporter-1